MREVLFEPRGEPLDGEVVAGGRDHGRAVPKPDLRVHSPRPEATHEAGLAVELPAVGREGGQELFLERVEGRIARRVAGLAAQGAARRRTRLRALAAPAGGRGEGQDRDE